MNEITESFRRVLVALANMPTSAAGLAIAMDVSISHARRGITSGVHGGYVFDNDGTFTLTDHGRAAIVNAPTYRASKQVHAFSKAVQSAQMNPMEFAVYVPPHYDHNDFRPGSMDAYKLPSLTAEGRVWP